MQLEVAASSMNFFEGLPLFILDLIRRMNPVLVCEDWRQMRDNPYGWIIFDPAGWMLNIKNFGIEEEQKYEHC